MISKLINVARSTATILVAISALALPATTYADTSVPSIGGVSIDTGDISGDVSNITDLVTAKAKACVLANKNTDVLYPSAVVDNYKWSTQGELDYIWQSAATAGFAADTSCVTGLKLQFQMTDSTPIPNCTTAYLSPLSTTYNQDNVPGTHYFSSYNPIDNFRVPYFTDSVRMNINPNDITVPQNVGCERLTSNLTEQATAYYQNSLGQYVLFCQATDTWQVLATTTGPIITGDSGQNATCQ